MGYITEILPFLGCHIAHTCFIVVSWNSQQDWSLLEPCFKYKCFINNCFYLASLQSLQTSDSPNTKCKGDKHNIQTSLCKCFGTYKQTSALTFNLPFPPFYVTFSSAIIVLLVVNQPKKVFKHDWGLIQWPFYNLSCFFFSKYFFLYRTAQICSWYTTQYYLETEEPK